MLALKASGSGTQAIRISSAQIWRCSGVQSFGCEIQRPCAAGGHGLGQVDALLAHRGKDGFAVAAIGRCRRAQHADGERREQAHPGDVVEARAVGAVEATVEGLLHRDRHHVAVFHQRGDVEAIGHGLEGDFNRKGSSAFSGRIGQRVAAKGVTVLDDGTIADRRGSLNVDDEGHASQKNVLIEDGILRGYIQDAMNARLMGVKPTGNGRRESYAHVPMPRMTNTYMLGGDKDPQEIVASIKKGLYATNFGGGQVDITSGKFVFSASEAYWVENGKILYPVKGATLIGSGPESLKKISMIGNDMRLDSGVGTCGKEGQSVPVGVGQPTLRIDGLTVGGTV